MWAIRRGQIAGRGALDATAAPATPPAITYAGTSPGSTNGQTQTTGSISIPASVADQFCIVSITLANGPATLPASITLNPSAGGTVTANLVEKHDASSGSTNLPCVGIYAGTVAAGSTSLTVSVTFGANPFTNCRAQVGTIPAADLLSTTATGFGKDHQTTSLTATATLNTVSGGAIWAIGADVNTTGGNAGVFTGTETFGAVDVSNIANGGTHSVDHVNGVTTNAANSVTVTFGNAAHTTLVVAAWR